MAAISRRRSIALGRVADVAPGGARLPESEPQQTRPSRLRSGTVYSPGGKSKTNANVILTPGKKSILCKYMEHTPYPTYEDYLQLENFIELPISDLKKWFRVLRSSNRRHSLPAASSPGPAKQLFEPERTVPDRLPEMPEEQFSNDLSCDPQSQFDFTMQRLRKRSLRSSSRFSSQGSSPVARRLSGGFPGPATPRLHRLSLGGGRI